jgi:hypothetical protein
MRSKKCMQVFGWNSRRETAAWRTQVKMVACFEIYVKEVEFEIVDWTSRLKTG